jgi:hypothetical protein
MAEREALTAAYVRSILHYDPETGVFTWRERPREHFKTKRAHSVWNARYAHKVSGCLDNLCYWNIRINGRAHKSHRLAWLWMTGEWPKADIDHIGGDPLNNSWNNLRDAARSENMHNTCAYSNNTSGRKGVSWNSYAGKWRVQIMKDGKRSHIGYFDEDKLEDAAGAYNKAARELHGKFART